MSIYIRLRVTEKLIEPPPTAFTYRITPRAAYGSQAMIGDGADESVNRKAKHTLKDASLMTSERDLRT